MIANCPVYGGYGGYPNTPLLDAQFENFEQRIGAGTRQGNLTPVENALLSQEMGQFQQNWATDEAQGMTSQDRQQLWNEASQINQSIFDLRHNDLGSMGPGGPNAKAPLTFLQDVQQGKPVPWPQPDPQPQPFPWEPPVSPINFQPPMMPPISYQPMGY